MAIEVVSALGSPASPVAVLAFAALTGFGMLAGVWAIRRFESLAVQHTGELIAFAAGLLVSGALLHLIGRAVELTAAGVAFGWTLTGFTVFYLLEAHFVPHVHARGEAPIDDAHGQGPPRSIGPLVITGLALHSIVDGVSVGAGLSAGTYLGSITVLLVVVHKMPVGMAAMSALYHSGVTGGRAVWVSTLLSLVTPVTVVVSYFVLRGISPAGLAVLLALAGGSFLYIGAADLLPEGQARGRPANTLMFLGGTLIMVLVKLLVP